MGLALINKRLLASCSQLTLFCTLILYLENMFLVSLWLHLRCRVVINFSTKVFPFLRVHSVARVMFSILLSSYYNFEPIITSFELKYTFHFNTMNKIHRKTGRICKLVLFSRLDQGGRSIGVAIKCLFLVEILENKVQMSEVLALDNCMQCQPKEVTTRYHFRSFELEVFSWNNRFRFCY